ncbi:chloride channel protein [Hydrogenivirga sp. 128-5-R1-1]|uniref:chloride channel protein n=1 Tax=Hydrogenivirga sp. 128-5-R1-1 TaxID=392423 RepID=UPI00015EFA4C|nr:chloride channel protein [Hydrogenivirga sp. 128-5-R1-1]EDP75239.1 tRNA (uracil-5-)-methyltransferase Gid [Hydrogenivirga sp. 128-5-R1-1]
MLRRYLLLPITIGVLTGLFAVLFVHALEFLTHYVLELVVGYLQPLPAGEGTREHFSSYPERPYLLPLTVALGGLVSGLLAHFLSPESAGVGTDAAIRAYHNKDRLSIKSSVVKLVTSAITIGTGGTSGREGPIALIGAGVGSTVGELFRLNSKERRTALAVGLGAGIAAIFKAPLAGAIISAEVFFRRDFEIEAMIPGFIASVTSYSIFGLFFGFQPIFSAEIPKLLNVQPFSLLAYAGLGFVCAIVVRVFTFVFFKVKEEFDKPRLPTYLKPALGGFVAGLIGAFVPVAIGNGYGWLQLILDGKLNDLTFIVLGALAVMLGVSFTLGSGMSGGVFGPSVMIGGLVGAAYSLALNQHYSLSLHVPSFTIVGMVSLFAGAAKAPLSTLILIAEMTGGYELLVPAMVSVFISYFLSGKKSIFPSQVDTRLDSPAHMDEWGLFILEKLKVRSYMKEPITVKPYDSVEKAYRVMMDNLIGGVPVANGGKLVGIVTKSDVMSVPHHERSRVRVHEIMSTNLVVVTPEDTLGDVFRLMTARGVGRLPVVDKRGSRRLVGIIARADIGRAIREFST